MPMMKPHHDDSNFENDNFWGTRRIPTKDEVVSGEIDPLATVRCPVCSFPIIAIMGRKGPRFTCGCKGYER